ncbi:MAG: asparagine synthase (glutamine-hydrolyzing) [Acidobacteriaceae bacterium]|nr:asparagine synthase (glutamine-hydrolyzing) [Acidobacteriaceae bacterium]
MCGIAGFTHIRFAPRPGAIEAAVRTLIHRGPDQQGIFESNLVSMGAARLKIIDLQSGDQPIRSHNGDCVIAFNGEIYNHSELRAELERRGHRFQSRCDTETVLEAFLEWDTECFSRFRGMFAVALWTESSQRLILARDRLGIKPLYTCFRGSDLYFGSELKALFIHPEIDRRLSLDGLDCYLSLNYVPSPWTMVEGIEKLQPGHWLEWKAGKVRSEAYWQLIVKPEGRTDRESAKEKLDLLLTESMREHLLSDVPLGVWLSGGIDSSTILHYAAAAAGRRLRTYSISFKGRSFDETPYAREVAEHYGTEHEELDLRPDEVDLENAIEQFADYMDEPNADGGALPVWFLSKLTRQTATVVLSGEGADEIFGGYLTHAADILAGQVRKLPRSVLRIVRRGAEFLPVSDDKISFEYKAKRFLEGLLLEPARAHTFWNGTFSDQQKRSLVAAVLPPSFEALLAEMNAHDGGLAAYLWFDQKFFLPDDILMKVDRMSMAHSIEVRPPFLDHRIAEFAAQLPNSFKISRGHQKVLLRELMRSKLPRTVTRRKKIGLDFPAHDWLRGPLHGVLADTFADAEARYSDFFSFEVIRTCIAAHLNRRANLGYHLWGLMMLFLWMKRWRIQTVAKSQAVGALEPILTSM